LTRSSWLAWFWPLLLLLASAAFAQDPVPVPALSSPVTDLTQTLTADQRAALDSRLRAYETQKGTQIAVLIVPTTQPESIEQYSIRVAEQWKIGRQGVDDGVILVVAKNDRAVRIEVGTGLEGALPDVLASRIISQVIVPRFRDGDFAGGINEAITRITALLEGEPLPEPERPSSPPARERSSDSGNWLPVLLMFVFVGSNILRGIFGRVGGAFATGGIAGVLMWFLTWTLGLTIVGAVIAFVFTLLFGGGGGGFGGGRGPGGLTRRRRGGLTDGWVLGGGLGGLGGSSGGSRSSGGFGGFGGGGGGGWSGGGGGFSGGGASGRW
jgi:uncharacterized protein